MKLRVISWGVRHAGQGIPLNGDGGEKDREGSSDEIERTRGTLPEAETQQLLILRRA